MRFAQEKIDKLGIKEKRKSVTVILSVLIAGKFSSPLDALSDSGALQNNLGYPPAFPSAHLGAVN